MLLCCLDMEILIVHFFFGKYLKIIEKQLHVIKSKIPYFTVPYTLVKKNNSIKDVLVIGNRGVYVLILQ